MIDPAPFLRTPFLRELFDAAVAAASPDICVPPYLPEPPKGRTVVVGAGKAAASMARAVEERWAGPLEGLVVTRYGHSVPTLHIEVVEAGHPMPDAAGTEAARRIIGLVQGLTADDLVLALISGGGSALLSLPAPGITLADKQAVNQALLRSGAPIAEINCVRKHLSAIKGGRLALAAQPARVVSLIISDVPGDVPATVAGGPPRAPPPWPGTWETPAAKRPSRATRVSPMSRTGSSRPPRARWKLRRPLRARSGSRRSCSATISRVRRGSWRPNRRGWPWLRAHPAS